MENVIFLIYVFCKVYLFRLFIFDVITDIIRFYPVLLSAF